MGKHVTAFVRKHRTKEKFELPYERQYFGTQYRRSVSPKLYQHEGQVHIRLERADKDRFLHLLHEQKMPVSQWVRERIYEWLAIHDKKD